MRARKDLLMRWKGINYDTGFAPVGDSLSRESFDSLQVRREMEIIARDLNCNAVRISGRDPARIALAAEYALAEGLTVWFAPFPTNLTAEELIPYFAACAQAAEALRQPPSHVVFVLGCEMSLFNSGFIPGATMQERMRALMNPALLAGQPVSPDESLRGFNSFLARAAAAVRERFLGPITYASGVWEQVDWSLFDIVGVDAYRDAGNRNVYREQLRAYAAHKRPVVVTEFGCCTYKGAQDRGGLGWAIVDRAAQPPRLSEDVVRDEQTQVEYLAESLDIFEEEQVEGAFWFTFASYTYPWSADPRHDLDAAAYGVVRVLDGATGEQYPGISWEPKQVFYALAERYAQTD
jgi:hypothetical protein